MRNTLLLAKKLKKRHVQYLIVAVFFLFLGYNNVKAEILTDNFESYNLGTLQQQDVSQWYKPSFNFCHILDNNDNQILGASATGNSVCSLVSTSTSVFALASTDYITTGQFDFRLGKSRVLYSGTVCNAGDDYLYIKAYDSSGNDLGNVLYFASWYGGWNYRGRASLGSSGTTLLPIWTRDITRDFFTHYIEFDTNTLRHRFKIEGYNSDEWSDWFFPDSLSLHSVNPSDIAYYGIYILFSEDFRFNGSCSEVFSSAIDNVNPFVDPEIYYPFWAWDYDIGIEVLTPDVGEITELLTGTTTSTGNWEVKEHSNLTWYNIYAVLKDLATGNSFLFNDQINGVASSTGSFEININGLPDGNYSICWASDGIKIPYATRWAYFYCEEENRTILRVGDYPELPRYILLENFEPCDYEDCDNLNVLETLTCRISNFLTSLTCPDPEKLLDLQLTIEEMKNRFPVSYLKLVRQEYNFLREEIQEKNSISMSIFGNETEVNVNYFEDVTDENDISLMFYIKTFINGLIALSFVLYGIYFIKRIF